MRYEIGYNTLSSSATTFIDWGGELTVDEIKQMFRHSHPSPSCFIQTITGITTTVVRKELYNSNDE